MTREWKPHWDHERVDETYCRASVHDEGRGVGFHQCGNRAKYDGKWCGIHCPGAAEERERKRGPSKFQKQMAAAKKRREYVEGLEAEVERLQTALGNRCQCHFQDGVLASVCHWHACAMFGRDDNGDPLKWELDAPIGCQDVLPIDELKAEVERLQDAVQDVLCSPTANLDTATMSKLQAVRGPARERLRSPVEVECIEAEVERLRDTLTRLSAQDFAETVLHAMYEEGAYGEVDGTVLKFNTNDIETYEQLLVDAIKVQAAKPEE